jgi:bacteriocin-like protein
MTDLESSDKQRDEQAGEKEIPDEELQKINGGLTITPGIVTIKKVGISVDPKLANLPDKEWGDPHVG